MGNGIIKCNDRFLIFQVTHLKLDAEPPAKSDWHASLTLQQLQHSGLDWKPLIGP